MRILMYGWEYPPFISGGLGVACQGIAMGLAKHHVKISLILPGCCKNIAREDNIEILACGWLRERGSSLNRSNSIIHSHKRYDLGAYSTLQDYFKNDSQYFGSLKALIKNILPEKQIELSGKYGNDLLTEVLRYANIGSKFAQIVPHDIIYAHDWLTILAGIKAKEISKKPLVLHIHSIEFDRNGEHFNQLIYGIEKYGLERADKIVAVSNYTKRMIQKFYGIHADKIEVVHNGVSDQYIDHHPLPRKLPSKKMILFLGRITYQKGPIYFILAAHKVLAYRKDVKFVIAGEGDQTRQMIEYVAALKQGKNILFTGFLNQDRVKYLYAMSDIYVMPSTSEPFGITCLEALSYGVPIIISKCSGAIEVVKHALKVDFWDVDGIASKMIALLDYPSIKAEQLYQARREMLALRWDNAARKLINIYEKMMR